MISVNFSVELPLILKNFRMMGCASSVECPRCDYKIRSGSAFLNHLYSVHEYKRPSLAATAQLKATNNNNLTCPKCSCLDLKSVPDLLSHLEEEHSFLANNATNDTNIDSEVTNYIFCPKCGSKIESGNQFLEHLESEHFYKYTEDELSSMNNTTDTSLLSCPKCGLMELSSAEDLVNHLEKVHPKIPNKTSISCPKCNISGFTTGKEFLYHLADIHSLRSENEANTVPTDNSLIDDTGNTGYPKVGDRVLAMWSGSVWQYFHATIRRFLKDELKYEIDWDDQDTSGRIVDYFNLAVDRVPLQSEVGIGSIVLFQQGRYRGQEGVRTGGVRWHQGKITQVYTESDGVKRYDGCHTKGAEDGKWVTFSGYSPTFEGYKIDDFRVGPNVFNIVSDVADTSDSGIAVDDEDIDIYFSFTPVDSPNAIKRNEVTNVPQTYHGLLDNLCDPMDIASNLQAKGLKVVIRKVTSDAQLKNTVSLMKKAKVFVACISDQYVANDQCRMEFQFAKKSLNKPVIPLVVGDGSFEWTVSVVGMLIAGELYIHFKDKNIENAKNEELLRSLMAHLPTVGTEGNDANRSVVQEGPYDIFVSYCWSNSFKALQAQHIAKCVGHEFSDPRLIEKLLTDMGYNCWIDIDRLQSRSNDAGMYEQLTKALRDAKVVLPCVSAEYAASSNCRMEFQFALKTLGKPVIPIVVGEGSHWKQTVIGALVSTNERNPLDLQNITDRSSLDEKIKELEKEIRKVAGNDNTESSNAEEKPKNKKMQRAPQVGDHVVCHHFNYAYYMATVVSFDRWTLKYEVNWDDGDPSGRIQPYNQVAVDVVPDADDVGVGSVIFFPQGSYSGTTGNNTGGVRYHEGVVTSCRKEGEQKLFSGHHTKGEADEKWVTYRQYSYEFYDMTLSQIRIAPTALDAFTSGTDY